MVLTSLTSNTKFVESCMFLFKTSSCCFCWSRERSSWRLCTDFFIFTEINQQQQQQQQQLQQLQQQVEILKLMIVWKRPDVKFFLLQFNGLARIDNKLGDEAKKKKTWLKDVRHIFNRNKNRRRRTFAIFLVLDADGRGFESRSASIRNAIFFKAGKWDLNV